MSTKQLALDLSEVDSDPTREKPGTFRWCEHCADWILRSRWEPHEMHHWRAERRQDGEDVDEGDEDDSEDEPERVGAFYTVELSFSVDYRFKIPAWNEHQAKDVAELLALDEPAADRMLVHSTTSEGKQLFEDSDTVPDGFDPYDGERLYDAIQAASEDDGGESS